MGEELEVSDDGRNLRQVIQSELLSLVGHVIALRVDDAEHKVACVLAIREQRVLVAVALPEVAGERAQRHAVHIGAARAIGTLDVHGELSTGRFMNEAQVWIEILLRAQFDLQPVRLREFDKHGKEQQLNHLGNDLGVHRNRVDTAVHVDEALDDPLAFVRRDRFPERRRVGLKLFEKLFGRHGSVFYPDEFEESGAGTQTRNCTCR